MAAALLGVSGATLSGGAAQAQTACGEQISWAAWTGGQSVTCGDKTFSYLSTSSIGDLASALVSAVQPVPGDYLFNLDLPDFTSNAFNFSYQAQTAASRFFTAVDLDTNADKLADPPSIVTATYSFTGGNSPIVLTSPNGDPDIASVLGAPTTITVENDYNGAGAIDALQNSFQQNTSTVPGPLPILGASAALGFSRKLRRRSVGNLVKT